MTETATRFAAHEVYYLLSTRPGPGAETARAALRLREPLDPREFEAAGLSSLYVRDLAVVESEDLRLSGAAAVLGYVLTSRARWVELALSAPNDTDAAFLVTAGDVTLLLSPRFLGTLEVYAVNPEHVEELAAQTVLDYLNEHADAVAYIRPLGVTPPTGIAARRRGTEIEVSGPPPAAPVPRTEADFRADLTALLRAALPA